MRLVACAPQAAAVNDGERRCGAPQPAYGVAVEPAAATRASLIALRNVRGVGGTCAGGRCIDGMFIGSMFIGSMCMGG